MPYCQPTRDGIQCELLPMIGIMKSGARESRACEKLRIGAFIGSGAIKRSLQVVLYNIRLKMDISG